MSLELSMPITASDGGKAFASARQDLDDLIKRRFFYRQAFDIYDGQVLLAASLAPRVTPAASLISARSWT